MNSLALPTTEIGGDYMKSNEGYFVAWSLATPGHGHGDWSLIVFDEVMETIKGKETLKIVVRFVRGLSRTEVVHIKSQSYLWWGVMLKDWPWALVKCRPGLEAGQVPVHFAADSDPLRATGV